MSLENQIRNLIRDELRGALAPLARNVAELQRNGDLTAQLRAALGGASVLRRGPTKAKAARAASKPSARRGRSTFACAVVDCPRPARTKGYCASHYQKRRNLQKTKRLPADWTENPKPHSVVDVVLPRGRAGAKALAEAKK